MPMKTCPGCDVQCGPRTLKCKECGHDFSSSTRTSTPTPKRTKRRFRQLCGIGAWINDPPKNMPQVEEPSPLSSQDATLDITTISNYIAYEGIGFCVIDYIDPKKIADPKLRAMWDDAKNRLTEIIDYVGRREIEAAADAKKDQ